MKRTETYKMSKRLKTMLALMPFQDGEERARFKNRMINAEIYAAKSERVHPSKAKTNDE
jgi:hypothetical protein